MTARLSVRVSAQCGGRDGPAGLGGGGGHGAGAGSDAASREATAGSEWRGGEARRGAGWRERVGAGGRAREVEGERGDGGARDDGLDAEPPHEDGPGHLGGGLLAAVRGGGVPLAAPRGDVVGQRERAEERRARKKIRALETSPHEHPGAHDGPADGAEADARFLETGDRVGGKAERVHQKTGIGPKPGERRAAFAPKGRASTPMTKAKLCGKRWAARGAAAEGRQARERAGS